MKTHTELREELMNLYVGIKSGTVDLKMAAELNNTVGKLNAANKIDLLYHEQRKSTPMIPFHEIAQVGDV